MIGQKCNNIKKREIYNWNRQDFEKTEIRTRNKKVSVQTVMHENMVKKQDLAHLFLYSLNFSYNFFLKI